MSDRVFKMKYDVREANPGTLHAPTIPKYSEEFDSNFAYMPKRLCKVSRIFLITLGRPSR